MFLLGLTGGIATGKTTASTIFQERGVPVIDADLIAREVVEPGKPAWHALRKAFGVEYFDDANGGMLLREKLGQLVFSDVQARRRLNAITHPAIIRETIRQVLRYFFSGARYIVLDTPLLFEAKYDRFMQRVIVVDCPDDVQLHRLMARDNSTEEDARNRISSQMPMAEKRKRATDLIDNSRSREETIAQLIRLIDELDRSWLPYYIRVGLLTAVILLGWVIFTLISWLL